LPQLARRTHVGCDIRRQMSADLLAHRGERRVSVEPEPYGVDRAVTRHADVVAARDDERTALMLVVAPQALHEPAQRRAAELELHDIAGIDIEEIGGRFAQPDDARASRGTRCDLLRDPKGIGELVL